MIDENETEALKDVNIFCIMSVLLCLIQKVLVYLYPWLFVILVNLNKLCLYVLISLQMPPKPLEPLAKKLMKGVIVLELLGVLGAYGLFHMMNNSQGITLITLKEYLQVSKYFTTLNLQ